MCSLPLFCDACSAAAKGCTAACLPACCRHSTVLRAWLCAGLSLSLSLPQHPQYVACLDVCVLQELQLAKNHVGVEGARQVAQGLSANTSLVSLNLEWWVCAWPTCQAYVRV